jgi:ankyrin repeat protein
MFPNPQDALPIPPRPNLDHYKKRAKDLLKAFRSFNAEMLHACCADWLNSLVRLSSVTSTESLDQSIAALENFARTKLSQASSLSAAQFVIARAHGFESWPQFAKHISAVCRRDSAANHFELAADAIVSGDIAALQTLLRQHPNLIRARSARRHQATLLHYISANGVENYRQKTPANIVRIAALLINTGAEVDASADVYGGSTTLGLVATSLHPERAGVQIALLDLLLEHGASLNAPGPGLVNVCLANGRTTAAQFLASRAATLDLEAAAGLGRLDTVKSFFDKNGDLRPPATNSQMERGFLWACEYGRDEVVEFLFQRKVAIETQADIGQTALHCAVIGGRLDTVKLLLHHGAPLEAKNSYGASALGQALWSALREPEAKKSAEEKSDEKNRAEERSREKKSVEKKSAKERLGEKEFSDKALVEKTPVAKDSGLSRPATSSGQGIDYIPIIETLLKAGAKIEQGTLDWIAQHKSASPFRNQRLTDLLKRYQGS